MIMVKTVMFALLIVACAGTAMAASTTSAYDNFDYTYTIMPDVGEELRSFHVYTSISACDVEHYYNLIMPAGWSFDTVPSGDNCVLTFFTDGPALPVGQVADFGFTAYCAPCCHSWYVSDVGTNDPQVTEIDSDENHTEACNIPAEFGECGGPGLLLAPVYPVGVAADLPTWGELKVQYR